MEIVGQAISINITAPTRPIDIVIGLDRFTDEDVKTWATGDLRGIDFATGQESLIIEYLSRIIVEYLKR
jgi:hypothetical protein